MRVPALWFALGCTGAPTDPDTDTVPSDSTADTAAPIEAFDCSTVPTTADEQAPLDAPRGYNDVVFDDDGGLIGHDGTSLVRATTEADAALFVPNVALVYKMVRFDDGRIFSAREPNGLLVLDPDGSRQVFADGLALYGVERGPDGLLYVSTNFEGQATPGIYRVDPDTGDTSLFVDASPDPPRDLAFSTEGRTLYFGTLSGGGVYAVRLDANTEPLGPPERVATVPQGWHDTIEVDACGNVYVGSVFCSCIYRVNPAGQIQTLLDWSGQNYGHGLTWTDGSGVWSPTSGFVTHPYIGSRVSEIDLGVPGVDWPGPVVGGGVL